MTARKIKCLACEEATIPASDDYQGPGVSRSRYARINICSSCGVQEAFEGFFWRERCKPELIKEHHR